MQRLRIQFTKNPAMRFTGHLDLHRAWERAFRRAGLPLAYSQGFNPHPRINLAAALPLGFTSECEIADVWLDPECPLAEVESRLASALPPGMSLTTLEQTALNLPALQTQVEAAEYVITFLDPLPNLPDRLEALLAASNLPRQRRGKTYDLRRLIINADLLPVNEEGNARMSVLLSARESATGRPEEVLAALGADPLAARFHRTRLLLQENETIRSPS